MKIKFVKNNFFILVILLFTSLIDSKETKCDQIATSWLEPNKVTKPVMYAPFQANELYEICKNNLYLLGVDVKSNDYEIINALKNNPNALRIMGYFLDLENYVEKTDRTFEEWRVLLSKAGSSYALNILSVINYRKNNLIDAELYANQAIEKGNYFAYETLWKIHILKNEKNPSKESLESATLFINAVEKKDDFRAKVIAYNVMAIEQSLRNNFEKSFEYARRAILSLDHSDINCGTLFTKSQEVIKNDFYCVDDILQPAHTAFSLRSTTTEILDLITNKSLRWWLVNRATARQNVEGWYAEVDLLIEYALNLLDEIKVDSNFVIPDEGLDWYLVNYLYRSCMSKFNLNLNKDGLDRAEKIFEIIASDKEIYDDWAAYSFNCLGLHQDQLGGLTDAYENYQKSYQLRKDDDYYAHAWLNTNMGLSLVDLDNLNDASIFLDKAHEYFTENKENNPSNYANSLSNLGYLYLKQNNLLKAKDTFKEALNLQYMHSVDSNEIGFTMHHYLNTLLIKEDYDEIVKVGELFLKKFIDVDIETYKPRISTNQNNKFFFQYANSMQLANIFSIISEAKNKISGGIAGYDEAIRSIALIENFKEYNGNSIYSNFDEIYNSRDIYARYFYFCTKLSKESSYLEDCANAFQNFNISKKQLRLKNIAQEISENNKKDSLEKLVSLSSTKQETLNALMLDESSRRYGTKEKLLKKLAKIDQEIFDTENYLKTIDKDLFEYFDNKALKISEIQQKINPNEAIISFFVTKNYLYVLEIRTDFTEVHKLNISQKFISDSVRELRKSVDVTELIFIEDLPKFDYELSKNLYQKILSPITQDYKLMGINHIIFVKDLYLSQIPFSILVTEIQNVNDISWLSDQFSFSSLKELQDIKKENISINKDIKYIAFANPDISETNFTKIPETEIEVIAVAKELKLTNKEFNENIFLQQDATEFNFRNLNLTSLNILHFATHNFLNKKTNEPSLLLSKDESDDGILSSSEIASKEISSDFVILSACSTALIDEKNNTDIFDLSRAFQFSGSNSIFVSHWDVESSSTSNLIQEIIKNINNENTKSLAYQKTINKIKSYKDTSHPFFWASFELVGIR